MDSVFNRCASLLEGVGQFPHGVLCLGDSESIARHDHNSGSPFQHHGDLLRPGTLDLPCINGIIGDRGCGCSESAEEHPHQRTVHRFAHDRRQNQPRSPHERTCNHKHRVIDHKPSGGCSQPGIAIEQTDHNGHVGATDRQRERATKPATDDHKQPVEDRPTRVGADGPDQEQGCDCQSQIDLVANGIGPCLFKLRQFFELCKGHEAAPKRNGTDEAGTRSGNRELRPRRQLGDCIGHHSRIGRGGVGRHVP